ncbi:MAG: hypothetical protein ACI8WB_004044 [Phenylobacterium sp.]|jgi:hypothetical protein
MAYTCEKGQTMATRSLFVDGLLATDANDKSTAFKQVMQIYVELPSRQKIQAEENWRCAGMWLYYQGVRNKQIDDWLIQWQEYQTRQNGFVPQWMLDLAEKLRGEWPS